LKSINQSNYGSVANSLNRIKSKAVHFGPSRRDLEQLGGQAASKLGTSFLKSFETAFEILQLQPQPHSQILKSGGNLSAVGLTDDSDSPTFC
jgi:hypothetical protein